MQLAWLDNDDNDDNSPYCYFHVKQEVSHKKFLVLLDSKKSKIFFKSCAHFSF